MSFNKLCAGLLGLLAMATFTGSAQAQIFSNSSGYNSSNAHGYTSGANRGGVGRFADPIIARATQLNQSLTAAEQAVVDAEYRASSDYNKITRYARQAGTGQADCPPTAEALAELERARANLAQVTAEANSFMQTVQNPTGDQITKTSSCVNCTSGW
jgi:hypothetical protein